MKNKNILAEFLARREKQNEAVLSNADKVIKRIYSADSLAYRDGALPVRTKELLGLTASLVLRCDDCITWHMYRCWELEIPTAEVVEALGIGTVVGGTITVPHVRRAMTLWESMKEDTVGEQ